MARLPSARMHPTTVDWVALGIVGLAGLAGLRRGLVASAFSLAGLALGAYAGSRVAPHLLHGGAGSPWAAVAGARRRGRRRRPAPGGRAPRRLVRARRAATDAVRALRLAGRARGRRGHRRRVRLGRRRGGAARSGPDAVPPGRAGSGIVSRLNSVVPPRTLLHLLARVDPFPSITGPRSPGAPPAAPVLGRPGDPGGARRASSSVLGTACGIGVEGSGWFAAQRPRRHRRARRRGRARHDRRDPGHGGVVVPPTSSSSTSITTSPCSGSQTRTTTPLPLVDPQDGTAVAIVGYPENGPLASRRGPDRAHADRRHEGRARARPGRADDHRRRGHDPPRQLRRPRDRRVGRGRSRRSSPRAIGRAERLRHPGSGRPRRPRHGAGGPVSTGVLRELASSARAAARRRRAAGGTARPRRRRSRRARAPSISSRPSANPTSRAPAPAAR